MPAADRRLARPVRGRAGGGPGGSRRPSAGRREFRWYYATMRGRREVRRGYATMRGRREVRRGYVTIRGRQERRRMRATAAKPVSVRLDRRQIRQTLFTSARAATYT